MTSPRGPGWVRRADRALDSAADLFAIAAGALLAVMFVINLVNIVLRNTGQGALLWVAPWTLVMMVWAVFLTFYVMYRRHLDIRLQLIVARCGPRGLRGLRLLAALSGLLVAGVLLIEAPQILARQRGVMELVGLTRYWLSVPLLASSAMLVLHFLLETLALVMGWHDADPPSETDAVQW